MAKHLEGNKWNSHFRLCPHEARIALSFWRICYRKKSYLWISRFSKVKTNERLFMLGLAL